MEKIVTKRYHVDKVPSDSIAMANDWLARIKRSLIYRPIARGIVHTHVLLYVRARIKQASGHRDSHKEKLLAKCSLATSETEYLSECIGVQHMHRIDRSHAIRRHDLIDETRGPPSLLDADDES